LVALLAATRWATWATRKAAAACRAVVALLMAVALVYGLGASQAEAHSVLLEAVPAPNATLSASPPEIRLTFNERMEKELYSIYVVNEQGTRMDMPAAQMSVDQRELIAHPPKLPDGVYTISYHIISADGHPVEQSYVVTVGRTAGLTATADFQHKHTETVYGFRMLHYLFLLTLIGWVAWRTCVPDANEEARRRYRKWLGYLRGLNLLFVLESLALQTIDAVGDITGANVASLWFHTPVGGAWLASVAVALAAYAVIGRSRALDAAWIIAAIAVQALSGHPLAAQPVWLAAIPDAIHLAAASLWAGGLGLLAVFVRRVPEAARTFLPRFSAAALYSMIALVATGAIMTLVYVPHLSDLLYTGWGRFLIAKLVLVALVVVAGSQLRRHLRHRGSVRAAAGEQGGRLAAPQRGLAFRAAAAAGDASREAAAQALAAAEGVNDRPASPRYAAARNASEFDEALGRWLQLDFALMVAIVAIVGIFTYLSPTPANVPLTWTIEGTGVTRSLSITPNSPGAVNQFAVYVTQDMAAADVKLVQLRLVSEDRPEVAPIEVELQRTETDARGLQAGRKLTAFTAEGRYLPFPGKWRAELTVRDANDDEQVWKRSMRIYAAGG
jgi:copper transport protein